MAQGPAAVGGGVGAAGEPVEGIETGITHFVVAIVYLPVMRDRPFQAVIGKSLFVLGAAARPTGFR